MILQCSYPCLLLFIFVHDRASATQLSDDFDRRSPPNYVVKFQSRYRWLPPATTCRVISCVVYPYWRMGRGKKCKNKTNDEREREGGKRRDKARKDEQRLGCRGFMEINWNYIRIVTHVPSNERVKLIYALDKFSLRCCIVKRCNAADSLPLLSR